MKQRKKVIILYGPPGVGKLTVAQELTHGTNLKLFHIHLLADLISSIFNTGTREFADSFVYLWLFLFKKVLATEPEGIVATLVYGVQTLEGKSDDQFFADIIQIAKEAGAEICFIQLRCSDIELNKRIQSESRKKFKKITDTSILKILRTKYKVDQQIPFTKSVEIDTTNLSPLQTATKIKDILKIR